MEDKLQTTSVSLCVNNVLKMQIKRHQLLFCPSNCGSGWKDLPESRRNQKSIFLSLVPKGSRLFRCFWADTEVRCFRQWVCVVDPRSAGPGSGWNRGTLLRVSFQLAKRRKLDILCPLALAFERVNFKVEVSKGSQPSVEYLQVVVFLYLDDGRHLNQRGVKWSSINKRSKKTPTQCESIFWWETGAHFWRTFASNSRVENERARANRFLWWNRVSKQKCTIWTRFIAAYCLRTGGIRSQRY